MLYRTTDRFPTATTEKPTLKEVESLKIEPYKTDTVITNESLAKPFKQVEDALKQLHIGGDNVRG